MKANEVTRGMLVLIDGKRARIGRTIGNEVEVDFAPGRVRSDMRRIDGETEVATFMVATGYGGEVYLDPVGEALEVDRTAGTAVRRTVDGKQARFATRPRDDGAAMKGGYIPTLAPNYNATKRQKSRDEWNAKIVQLRKLLNSKGFAIFPQYGTFRKDFC